MKNRLRKAKRPPANFGQLRRDRKDTRKAPGRVEVQSVGFGPQGELVCAGVHYCRELSARWAWRIYHNWTRWRKWYDALPWNAREDYPAKHSPIVAEWVIYPVANPREQVRIRVALPDFTG